MKSWRFISHFDFVLFVTTLILAFIGVAIIYSAVHQDKEENSINYPLKQLIWIGIGLAGFFLMVVIDYEKLAGPAYIFYGVVVLILALLMKVGHQVHGAQRWIHLGPFSFQPSEVAKLAVVIMLARYLSDQAERVKRVAGLFLPLILVFIPLVLILKQPDLGTAFTLIPILFGMLYLAGARVEHLLRLFGVGILLSPFLWLILEEYQKERIQVFIDPNIDPLGSGYNMIQSLIAIGSGMIIGKGWLMGTQTQMKFLPKHHTDFVFSVMGEEWGFVGAVAIFILYTVIIIRGIQATRMAKSMFGTLLAGGMTIMIAAHVFINVGMTTGIMPVVGLPLPLISYGGSSFLITMMALGIIANVRMRRFVF